MKQQPHKTYPQNDDPCPLHNGLHKWIDCYDNKRGPKFRPFTHPSQYSDQYLSESSFNASGQNTKGNNDTMDHNPYDDDEF